MVWCLVLCCAGSCGLGHHCIPRGQCVLPWRFIAAAAAPAACQSLGTTNIPEVWNGVGADGVGLKFPILSIRSSWSSCHNVRRREKQNKNKEKLRKAKKTKEMKRKQRKTREVRKTESRKIPPPRTSQNMTTGSKMSRKHANSWGCQAEGLVGVTQNYLC